MPTYLEAYRAARASQQDSLSPAPSPAELQQHDQKRSGISSGKETSKTAREVAKGDAEGRIAGKLAQDRATGDTESTPKTTSTKPTAKSPAETPSKPTPKPKIEVGKQKGLYDTKGLRTKVAKWQALDETASPQGTQEAQMGAAKKGKPGIGTGPKKVFGNEALDAAKENGAAEQTGKSESKPTTPKKRVVSDEHWKNTRSSPVITVSPATEAKLQHILKQRGLYVSPGGKNPEGWVRKRSLPSKKPDPGPAQDAPVKASTKAAIGKWASNVDDLNEYHEDHVISANEKAAKGIPDTDDVFKTEAAKSPRGASPREGKKKSSPKAGSAGDRKSSDPPEEPPQPPPPNRMQTWLMNTEDPFVEDLDDDDMFEGGGAPLGSLLAPRSTGVRDRDNQGRPRRRRSSNELKARGSTRTDSDVTSSSPSLGLKRSGARRAHDSKTPPSPSKTPARDENRLERFERSASEPRESHLAVQLAPVSRSVERASKSPKPMQLEEACPRPGLRRKTTSEGDLITVLSSTNDDRRELRPARRSSHTKNTTVQELVSDLQDDDVEYTKHLQTLVDGVVPVLLNYIVSGPSDGKPGISQKKSGDLAKAEDSIVDIGVSLERLQGLHKRPPLKDSSSLINWANRAHGVYAAYIRAWRLGFKDIVINLAPAEAGPGKGSVGTAEENDAQKDDTERADVTYLLKRPLVRLKYLTKVFKGLDRLQKSDESASLVSSYQSLMDDARSRQDQERARLEDEGAAAVDTTRVRDPMTLAPLNGVTIRSERSVRARDIFDLHMHHSSGQRLDCRVSLLLRDAQSSRKDQGDVLFCQLEDATRWLLLPPAELTDLSARQGDSDVEFVIMLRGKTSTGESWHELISLTASSDKTARDWIQMLGTRPVPPLNPSGNQLADDDAQSVAGTAIMSVAGTEVVQSEIDVPLGERSVLSGPTRNPRIEAWINSNLEHDGGGETSATLRGPRSIPSDHASSLDGATVFEEREEDRSRSRPVSGGYTARAKKNLKHLFSDLQASITPPSKPAERRRPRETRRYDPPQSPRTPRYPRRIAEDLSDEDDDIDDMTSLSRSLSPSPKRIPKAEPSAPIQTPSRPRIPRRLSTIASEGVPVESEQHEPTKDPPMPAPVTLDKTSRLAEPSPLSRQRYRHQRTSSSPRSPESQDPPARSPARSPVPKLTPTTPKSNERRRSSSPLKHEYQPSSESDASSIRGDILSDDEGSITSESSVEDRLPDLDYDPAKQFPTRSRPSSTWSPKGDGTLGPSQSASQAPFRSVPAREPDQNVNRTIASIFSWSNRGFWELLHPDECSVIVSPGLIEAFKLTAAHSHHQPDAQPIRPANKRPLIALELTPLVPLRQGTAIDISIRSPPTPASLLRSPTTNMNFMFRARSAPESDVLYRHINSARINNPTYIALQDARPSFAGQGWAAHMDKAASARSAPSWWRLNSRRGSYRASSSRRDRTASVAETRSSVASMSSALSALKRFSGADRAFSVARSTITSSNRHSRSTWTSSSGGTTGASGDGGLPRGVDPSMGSPAGILDQKIRLYEREMAGKWRDMGSARLTIMHPPKVGMGASNGVAGGGNTAAMISPAGHLKTEKRVLVIGKTKGETLLDVTAGETAFERVARTGIAVSVVGELEEGAGVKEKGGVGGARRGVFMLQMKSEAEAAYTFSIVGRLRY